MRIRREFTTPALLFVATIFTCTVAGVQQAVTIQEIEQLFPAGDISLWPIIQTYWHRGIPFSATLIGILLAHELGHYFAGRYHRIDVSLPYFIPAPTLIGTFGAVIRMRGPLWNRTGLIDVAAMGPLTGFIVAVPAYIWGMANSTIVARSGIAEVGFFLGDSILTLFIQRAVLGPLDPTMDVMLHPVAFAAWIGFFVTSLNMLPIGQLDGGHISYGLNERFYPRLSRLAFIGLLVMGAVGWKGWWFWAALTYLFGLDRHPRPMFNEPQLSAGRRAISLISYAVFILTFVPNPFMIQL